MSFNWNNVKPACCARWLVLPTVYSDALSYGEQLDKFCYQLNQLIENNNILPDFIAEMIKEYINSGAIGEVVRDILADYILNVKYPPNGIKPAVGDGSSDDTEAIQGCIDYASQQGGGCVYIPYGVYLTQPLEIKNNVSLIGFDRYSTKLVLKGGANKPMIWDGEGGTTGVSIIGLTLDGNMDTQVNNVNVVELTVNDCLLQNLVLTDGYKLMKLISNGGGCQISDIVCDYSVIDSVELLKGEAETLFEIDHVVVNAVSDLKGQYGINCEVDKAEFEQCHVVAEVPVALRIAGSLCRFVGYVENAVTDFQNLGDNNTVIINGKTIVEFMSGDKRLWASSKTEVLTGNKTVSAVNSTETLTGLKKTDSGSSEETVDGAKSIHVGGIYTFAVDDNSNESVGGNKSEIVTGVSSATYGGDRTVNGKNFTETMTEKKVINGQDIVLNPTNPLTYKEPQKLTKNFKYVPMKDSNGNVYKVLVEGDTLNISSGVSVLDFGAKGDGVTDDSDAFMKWLAYIIENSKHGFIPDGNYLINRGGLTYRTDNQNHWSITGESVEGTVLTFGLTDVETQPNCIDLRYCENFSMSNFTIQCPGNALQKSGVALYFVNVKHIFVKDIEVDNCSRCGVLAYAADYLTGGYCFDLHFENVNIHGVNNDVEFTPNSGRYLYPMGWILSDCVSTLVDNCNIDNIAWYGFEFKNYCRNSYFRRCNARNCVTACHIGGELKEGDTYGVACGGYIDISCYDVDAPIIGGSFRETVFKNVVAYYRSPYTWQTKNTVKKTYSARLVNVLNSVFELTLFNCPYGGVYFSDNSAQNVFVFKAYTTGAEFIGRNYFFDGSSKNNAIICELHNMIQEFVYRANDRNANNLIIDRMTGSYANMLPSNNMRRIFQMMNSCDSNTSPFNWSADTLTKSNKSVDNIVHEVYGDLNGKYVRVDYNTAGDKPYIDFRLFDGTTTATVRVDETGAHLVR